MARCSKCSKRLGLFSRKHHAPSDDGRTFTILCDDCFSARQPPRAGASCRPLSVKSPSKDQGGTLSELLHGIREHVAILAGDTSQEERIARLVSRGPNVIVAIESSIRWCIDAGRWENAGLLCEAAARIGGDEARELLRYYATAVSNIYEYETYIRPAAERGLAQFAGGQAQPYHACPAMHTAIPAAMTDQQMVDKLVALARYYAGGGLSKDNPELQEEVIEIGKALNRRGGVEEMLRVFAMVPEIRGKRTLDMEWDQIGDWRG